MLCAKSGWLLPASNLIKCFECTITFERNKLPELNKNDQKGNKLPFNGRRHLRFARSIELFLRLNRWISDDPSINKTTLVLPSTDELNNTSLQRFAASMHKTTPPMTL